MIPLILTASIGEEDEIQGRSLGRLLNRGGCNRPGPFLSHFHSLKSRSARGQIPAGGRETREAGSHGHPFRRVLAYYMIIPCCLRMSTFADSEPTPRNQARQIPAAQDAKGVVEAAGS